MSRSVGPVTAKLFADAHEFQFSTPTDKEQRSHAMDFWNNQVGINIYKQIGYVNYNDDDVITAIVAELDAGRMRIIVGETLVPSNHE